MANTKLVARGAVQGNVSGSVHGNDGQERARADVQGWLAETERPTRRYYLTIRLLVLQGRCSNITISSSWDTWFPCRRQFGA